MLRTLFGLIAALATVPGYAAADLSVIRDLVGQYPVLEWNGNPRVAGRLTVTADANGVGYRMEPLGMGSAPVHTVSVVTPIAETTLTREGNRIIHRHKDMRVEYRLENGTLEISSGDCLFWDGDTKACHLSSHISLSTGRSSGEKLEVKAFAESLKGSYRIELAGGVAPKEINNTGDVTPESTEVVFTMPYCPPKSGAVCDPGYLFLPYEHTQVYRRALGAAGEIFVILVKDGTKLGHYSLEREGDRYTFRNFQYPLDGQKVAMEHVLRKAQD